VLLAVASDLLADALALLVRGPEVDPGPDASVDDLVDRLREPGEVTPQAGVVGVVPRDPVRPEELSERLDDRAAQARVPRRVLRMGRVRNQRRPALRRWCESVRWLLEAAPSEREFLEWFFQWIYTPRAHNAGFVDQIIEEVLDFPYKQSPEDVHRFLDAFLAHETGDRLRAIEAPALVIAGGIDPTSRPELNRAVADLIPGARFEVMPEESHQPFQEVPDEWNVIVDAFWREVEAS
jgi:pimeloyl-ACP methyl ester carboxylesterase